MLDRMSQVRFKIEGTLKTYKSLFYYLDETRDYKFFGDFDFMNLLKVFTKRTTYTTAKINMTDAWLSRYHVFDADSGIWGNVYY